MTIDDFSPEALRRAAQAKSGHDDYGSDSYMPGLEALLYSLRHEANLNEAGLQEVWNRIVNALANRLTLVAWEKRNPEAAAAPIEAPLVVMGLPRTGSSILHETLAAAPDARTPIIWQVRDLSLVHAGDAASDPRMKAIESDIAQKNARVPGYAAMHFEDAQTPMECVALTIVDMVSVQFCSIAWAPSYRDFLLTHDMTTTYDWHRRALRLLQAGAPAKRWVLKAPAHAGYLGALLATYPDAMVIQTHRDPAKVVGSLASLFATLRRGWSDHVDPVHQAPEDGGYSAEIIRRAMTFRRAHPELAGRFYDVAFKAFMADPAGTLTGIYRHFGMELSDAALDAMTSYIRNRPREKYGKHEYSLADFGLSEDRISQMFGEYNKEYAAHL